MSGTISEGRQFEAPKITKVAPGDGDYVVNVTWVDGTSSRVDLTEPIFRLTHLRPLRNRNRFDAVKVGDWGWTASWPGNLDFSNEKLWDLAQQQASAVMVPSDFREWLKRDSLTQEKAAALLGISKRSIAYYATGALPVTRTIALAIKGIAAE